MSKLKKEITTMVQDIIDEPMPEPEGVCIVRAANVYDREFITRSFGLVPYSEGAFNPGSIVDMEIDPDGNAWINLHRGKQIALNAEEMITLEATIRRREQEAKEARLAQLKEGIIAQHDVVRELNEAEMHKVQPGTMGQMIINPAERKRRI